MGHHMVDMIRTLLDKVSECLANIRNIRKDTVQILAMAEILNDLSARIEGIEGIEDKLNTLIKVSNNVERSQKLNAQYLTRWGR